MTSPHEEYMQHDEYMEHDEVDALLQTLRATQPTPGMEQRILDGLAQQRVNGRSRQSSAWGPRHLIVAMTATSALLVAGVLIILHPHPEPMASLAEPVRPRRPVAATSVVEAAARQVAATPHTIHVVAVQKAAAAHDPIAARAAGFPAPPMPVTDQERLLLRLAQRGDIQHLAAFQAAEVDRLNAETPNEDESERPGVAGFFAAFLTTPAQEAAAPATAPTFEPSGDDSW